jgi:hypothetical protein
MRNVSLTLICIILLGLIVYIIEEKHQIPIFPTLGFFYSLVLLLQNQAVKTTDIAQIDFK